MPTARGNGRWGFGLASFALLLLVTVPPVPAQQETLRLVTLREEIPIGAAFEIGLETGPDGLDGATVTGVRFRDVDDRWHVAADWGQPFTRELPDEKWLWGAGLQAFEVGELQVPGAEAVIRRPDGTNEIVELKGPVINVVDGIDAADAELRDLHPIHPFRLDWRWVAAWTAGGLLAALALGLLFRRSYLARQTRRAFAPPPPPGEWALGEIERRRNLPECRAGHSKFIATEASDVIRRFLQRQYGFNALDMTTRECVRHLEGRYVPGRLPEAVRRILDECDVAKFTRLDLEPGRETGIWDDAKGVVALATREEADLPRREALAVAGEPSR